MHARGADGLVQCACERLHKNAKLCRDVFPGTDSALPSSCLSSAGLVLAKHDEDAHCTCAGGDATTPAQLCGAGCAGISFQGQIQLIAFCVFEFCVGLFWPSMMKMRAAHVPEEMRATIINFFRIPLNLFVCIVLYNVSILRSSGSCRRILSCILPSVEYLLCPQPACSHLLLPIKA